MVDLLLTGIVVALVGMGIMMVAVASHGKGSGGEARGGGVVMIGPIPIIFGTDAKWASLAVVLAIALIVIVLFAGML